MHDPKLIEAMARGVRDAGLNASRKAKAARALEALCTLRPDVAAVLSGEAVAVPKPKSVVVCQCGLLRSDADAEDCRVSACTHKETPDDR